MTRHLRGVLTAAVAVACIVIALTGCGGDDEAAAGSGGTAGSAGTAGSGGASGTSGAGGSAGTAGASGAGGDASTLNDAASDSGADAGTWFDPRYIKGSMPTRSARFGTSIAASGDTLVVGAPSITGGGDAYVFVYRDGLWVEQAHMRSRDVDLLNGFGWSVAIDGDTIVIGSHNDSSSSTGVNGSEAVTEQAGTASGAAHVYTRQAGVWTQQAYLKASHNGTGDQFGYAVAVNGDTIVVGAVTEDSSATGVDGDQANNDAMNAGAAYVFVRDGTTWTQQAYLKASNTERLDGFGSVVAVSGDTIAVSTTDEDSSSRTIDGDQGDNSAPYAGAVYVFARSGSTWTQQAYVKSSAAKEDGYFGCALALTGDTLVVGAYGEEHLTSSPPRRSGAAYVFSRAGTTWTEHSRLMADPDGAGDVFGASVAIHGGVILVGALSEDSSGAGINPDATDNLRSESGAAYVFTANGTAYAQTMFLKPINTRAYQAFGTAVAITATHLLIGASEESSGSDDLADTSALYAGAVYGYPRPN